MNQNHAKKQFVPFGACFKGVGNGQTFKLSDIKLAGGDCLSDFIQHLESTKASVDAKYAYVSEEESRELAEGDPSYAGWYAVPLNVEKPMDDVEFPIGTAFLANFGSKNVTIQDAGQVTEGGIVLDCTGKQFVMFAQITPRPVRLGEFVLSGGDCLSDFIQILDSESARASEKYAYVSEEESRALADGDPSYAGWYPVPLNINKPMNDVEIQPGMGFLANFGSKNVTIHFPTAVK